LAPFLLHSLARAVSGPPRDASTSRWSKWRRPVHTIVGLGLLGAIAGAFWPPAMLLLLLVAVVFAISLPLSDAVLEATRGAALAWLPTRLSPTLPVPAPDGVLVPAALGLALAAGLGVSALLDGMRSAHFGWRQVAAVAATVGLGLPVLALTADTVSGRWQLPS